MTRLPFDVYLDHLEADSARFADVLAGADPGARVPACPDWSAFDLAYHLAEVQHFWTQIVSRRLSTGDQVEAVEAAGPAGAVRRLRGAGPRRERPAAAGAAVDGAGDAGLDLVERAVGRFHLPPAGARGADPPARRRTGRWERTTPLPPALAADGVDEVLRIMYGGCPPWGTITPIPGRTTRIRCTDTGDTWLVTMATFTGDEPGGEHVEEADIHVADSDDGSDVPATISATAADLDAWLWHRVGRRPRSSSRATTALLGELRQVVRQGIN